MPLPLPDDVYDIVQAAAAPIHPQHRGEFLQALAGEIERHPVIGPGLVHRIAADLQHRYAVTARAEAELAGVPRHLPPRTC